MFEALRCRDCQVDLKSQCQQEVQGEVNRNLLDRSIMIEDIGASFC
jgi:hypothetical protein